MLKKSVLAFSARKSKKVVFDFLSFSIGLKPLENGDPSLDRLAGCFLQPTSGTG